MTDPAGSFLAYWRSMPKSKRLHWLLCFDNVWVWENAFLPGRLLWFTLIQKTEIVRILPTVDLLHSYLCSQMYWSMLLNTKLWCTVCCVLSARVGSTGCIPQDFLYWELVSRISWHSWPYELRHCGRSLSLPFITLSLRLQKECAIGLCLPRCHQLSLFLLIYFIVFESFYLRDLCFSVKILSFFFIT